MAARGDALRSILEARPVTRSQVEFVRALLVSDEDPLLRTWAGGAALEWEEEAAPLLDAFVSNLRDPNVAVRISAAGALVWIDSREEFVLRGLNDLVESESNYAVLTTALRVMGALGDWEGRRVLLVHLHSKVAGVREAAANGLGALGKADIHLIGELVRASRDPSPDVRAAVIMALCGLEPAGTQTRDVFLHATEDANASVRQWAAYGLGNLIPSENSERVVRALIKLLDGDPDADVQRSSAAAIATYGARARSAIEALERSRRRGVQNSTTALRIIREALKKMEGQ